MVENVKQAISPIVSLIKELNVQVKNNDIDIDFLLKLSTMMRVASLKIEKIVKENKTQLKGGVTKSEIVEEEE